MMPNEIPHLTLVLGGARSGKSRHAEALIEALPAPWTYIATAQAYDDEMRERIAEHRARRLIDWLKIEAQAELEKRCRHHAANLGVAVKSISMRSQSTRWGSCSSTGKLNFNWRLILAPPFVLDYVAAHEVSHMLEMNHSQDFWDVVERTLPTMERGREWLRIHGRELMVYGLE